MILSSRYETFFAKADTDVSGATIAVKTDSTAELTNFSRNLGFENREWDAAGLQHGVVEFLDRKFIAAACALAFSRSSTIFSWPIM